MKQINFKTIYLIAGFLMILIIGFNLWNLMVSWKMMNLPSKFSFIFSSILFQLLFAIMFFGLYKMTPNVTTITDNKELDKILAEYSK